MRLFRLDELRQKRQKEERDFWIQRVRQDALPVNCQRVCPFVWAIQLFKRRSPISEHVDAQIDEIPGSGVFDQRKERRRGCQQQRQAERGAQDMREAARADAEHGDESSAFAVRDAARENIHRIRAGRDVQRDARQQESEIIVDAKHNFLFIVTVIFFENLTQIKRKILENADGGNIIAGINLF